MHLECSTTDVLDFVIEVNAIQRAKVLVTVQSECQETSDGRRVTYTVTNDPSANTNVQALSVAGDNYIFDVATALQVLPGQIGTVTVTRPGAECKVTSEGVLTINFPTQGFAGPMYKNICVCTLVKECAREDKK